MANFFIEVVIAVVADWDFQCIGAANNNFFIVGVVINELRVIFAGFLDPGDFEIVEALWNVAFVLAFKSAALRATTTASRVEGVLDGDKVTCDIINDHRIFTRDV